MTTYGQAWALASLLPDRACPVHRSSFTGHVQVITSRGIEVDRGMAPILEKLWDLGFETWYSCEGTDYELGGYVFGPAQEGFADAVAALVPWTVGEVYEHIDRSPLDRGKVLTVRWSQPEFKRWRWMYGRPSEMINGEGT